MRVRLLNLLSLLLIAAQPAPMWVPAPGGADLTRPAFWEDFPDAGADDGMVSITGADGLIVSRYGPRLHLGGDFRLLTTLQSATDELAALVLVAPDERTLELGLDHGQVVLTVLDERLTFDVDAPREPLSLTLSRVGDTLRLDISGVEVARVPDPGFAEAALGAHVASGNTLTVYALSVLAPASDLMSARVDRCAPARLLVAGARDDSSLSGLWWVRPDDEVAPRATEDSAQRSFLVAPSPDGRWVAYYQRSSTDPSDRFVIDAWVLDVATDQRFKLVEDGSPRAWTASSSAVVLGERPTQMARVPSGELVPSEGPFDTSDGMRSAISPDRQWRATVATSSRGSVAVEIFAADSTEPSMSIPTGLGPVQLAWSPDSTRLAYTSSMAGQNGIVWRLRMVDVAERSVGLLDSTRDLQLHSVVWVRQVGDC